MSPPTKSRVGARTSQPAARFTPSIQPKITLPKARDVTNKGPPPTLPPGFLNDAPRPPKNKVSPLSDAPTRPKKKKALASQPPPPDGLHALSDASLHDDQDATEETRVAVDQYEYDISYEAPLDDEDPSNHHPGVGYTMDRPLSTGDLSTTSGPPKKPSAKKVDKWIAKTYTEEQKKELLQSLQSSLVPPPSHPSSVFNVRRPSYDLNERRRILDERRRQIDSDAQMARALDEEEAALQAYAEETHSLRAQGQPSYAHVTRPLTTNSQHAYSAPPPPFVPPSSFFDSGSYTGRSIVPPPLHGSFLGTSSSAPQFYSDGLGDDSGNPLETAARQSQENMHRYRTAATSVKNMTNTGPIELGPCLRDLWDTETENATTSGKHSSIASVQAEAHFFERVYKTLTHAKGWEAGLLSITGRLGPLSHVPEVSHALAELSQFRTSMHSLFRSQLNALCTSQLYRTMVVADGIDKAKTFLQLTELHSGAASGSTNYIEDMRQQSQLIMMRVQAQRGGGGSQGRGSSYDNRGAGPSKPSTSNASKYGRPDITPRDCAKCGNKNVKHTLDECKGITKRSANSGAPASGSA